MFADWILINWSSSVQQTCTQFHAETREKHARCVKIPVISMLRASNSVKVFRIAKLVPLPSAVSLAPPEGSHQRSSLWNGSPRSWVHPAELPYPCTWQNTPVAIWADLKDKLWGSTEELRTNAQFIKNINNPIWVMTMEYLIAEEEGVTVSTSQIIGALHTDRNYALARWFQTGRSAATRQYLSTI